MTNVIACIDGTAVTPAVCDYAAWPLGMGALVGSTTTSVMRNATVPVLLLR